MECRENKDTKKDPSLLKCSGSQKVVQCNIKHDSTIRYTCGDPDSDQIQFVFASRSTGRSTNVRRLDL